VAPEPIRPLHLHVHEASLRLVHLDARQPAEADAEEREPVLDERADAHRDGARRADLELQVAGRDRLEVLGIGEEGEDLGERPPDELLAAEVVSARHRVPRDSFYPFEEALARRRPP
jgi:hypothetical protein